MSKLSWQERKEKSLSPENYRLVEIYETEIGETPSLEQQLLLKMFKENVEFLPGDWENNPTDFHKAFRQTDVTSSGYKDMLIWNLMHLDDKIWTTLDKFFEGNS